MKDVHMDIPYKSMQLNLKKSSPIVYNKIFCETMEIRKFTKNSPKIEFCFFEIEIWYA